MGICITNIIYKFASERCNLHLTLNDLFNIHFLQYEMLVDYFPTALTILIEKATLSTSKVVSFESDIAYIDEDSKLHWHDEVIPGVINVWIDSTVIHDTIYHDDAWSSFIIIQSIAGTIIPVTSIPASQFPDDVLDIIPDGFDMFATTRDGKVVKCSASQTSLLANDVGKVELLEVKNVAFCIAYENSFVMIDVEGLCYTLDVGQKKKVTSDAFKALRSVMYSSLILTLEYLYINKDRQVKLPTRAKDIAVIRKINSLNQGMFERIIILTESGHLLLFLKDKFTEIPYIKDIVAISNDGNVLLNNEGQTLVLVDVLEWKMIS